MVLCLQSGQNNGLKEFRASHYNTQSGSLSESYGIFWGFLFCFLFVVVVSF